MGKRYREGDGVPVDECRAFDFFKQACTLGSGDGCTGLGAMYEDGICVEQSCSRARTAYEKACAAGSRMGCMNLGNLLVAGGPGVRKNTERGYGYLVKACRMGLADACDKIPLAVQLGVRGELDLLAPDTSVAVTFEFERGSFSLVAMLIVQYQYPQYLPGLRLEGRLHPLQWGPLRPYVGVSLRFDSRVAARGAAGVDFLIDRLHLFADVGWERYFLETEPSRSSSVPLALGLGWSF